MRKIINIQAGKPVLIEHKNTKLFFQSLDDFISSK